MNICLCVYEAAHIPHKHVLPPHLLAPRVEVLVREVTRVDVPGGGRRARALSLFLEKPLPKRLNQGSVELSDPVLGGVDGGDVISQEKAQRALVCLMN